MQKLANTPINHLATSSNKQKAQTWLLSCYISLVLPRCILVSERSNSSVWRHWCRKPSRREVWQREAAFQLRARGSGWSTAMLLQPPCNVLATAQIKKPCCPFSKSIFHLFVSCGVNNHSRCNLIRVYVFSQRSVSGTALFMFMFP